MKSEASTCAVGYSDLDITPNSALFLTGFANPVGRKGHGVRTPLMAQAICLDDQQGGRALILAVDTLGFDASWARNIRESLTEKTGIPSDCIILNASHTHCAPQIRKDEAFGVVEPCDEEYRNWLKQSLVTIGCQASQQCAPCISKYAVGINTRATYRRLWIGDRWLNAPNHSQEPERHMPIMELHSDNGNIFLVAVIAGHPTTASDPVYDSHYQGALRKTFLEAHGIQLLILSGAGGDSKMTIPLSDCSGWSTDSEKDISTISSQLENDLQDARQHLAPMTEWQIHSASAHVPLPIWVRPVSDLSPQEANAWRDNANKAATWSDLEAGCRTMEILVIGWNKECRWIFLEGEVCGEYGILLRNVFSAGETAVVAYSQGLLHYIPTERIALEGGYEGNASFSYVKPGETLLPCHPSTQSEIIQCTDNLRLQLEAAYR